MSLATEAEAAVSDVSFVALGGPPRAAMAAESAVIRCFADSVSSSISPVSLPTTSTRSSESAALDDFIFRRPASASPSLELFA